MKRNKRHVALKLGDKVELTGAGGTYTMEEGTRLHVKGIGGTKRRRIYFCPIAGTGHFGMFWRYELRKVPKLRPRAGEAA